MLWTSWAEAISSDDEAAWCLHDFLKELHACMFTKHAILCHGWMLVLPEICTKSLSFNTSFIASFRHSFPPLWAKTALTFSAVKCDFSHTSERWIVSSINHWIEFSPSPQGTTIHLPLNRTDNRILCNSAVQWREIVSNETRSHFQTRTRQVINEQRQGGVSPQRAKSIQLLSVSCISCCLCAYEVIRSTWIAGLVAKFCSCKLLL